MVKSYPQISVIMAVYNGEKYLNDSINGILNQTFEDLEFIRTELARAFIAWVMEVVVGSVVGFGLR